MGKDRVRSVWKLTVNTDIYIIDRAQIKSKEAIQKTEDENIFAALLAAAVTAQAWSADGHVVNNFGNLSVASLNTAFASIEGHDLVVTKIVMNAGQFASVRSFGKTFYDEATQREIITTGLYGHLYTADIHVSSKMPANTVLVVASADTVGALPIRQDISVLPADDPKKLRLGWIIYEEIGICVLNDYAVAKILVSSAS